jgi:hypothetical protein
MGSTMKRTFEDQNILDHLHFSFIRSSDKLTQGRNEPELTRDFTHTHQTLGYSTRGQVGIGEDGHLFLFFSLDGIDDLHALVQIQVSEIFRRVLGQGNFLVVEDDPATVLEDVADVVANERRRSHVRYEGDETVGCVGTR